MINDKVFKQGLRLSSECLFLARMEATYENIVQQHKGARQTLKNYVSKHKELS